MGPRLQERGVACSRSGHPLAHRLLQWGRAYKSAELDAAYAACRALDDASMGPRLQERGVRGVRGRVEWAQAWLQWGRAYKSAEFAQAGALPSRSSSWLQWGRAYKSAEFS